MNAGMKNSHKVGLLQDGVRFQQLTVEPEHAQFLETRQFEVRATVANIIGVPPHLLGDDTRTSHSSLEQENLSYLQRSLNPWLKEWESECNEKLLTEREKDQDSHFIEFNREAEIQMVYADKIEGIYRQMEMGLIDANEGRRLLNMPDLGEDGNRRYHPANWVVVGQEATEPAHVVDAASSQAQEPSQMSDILRQMVTSSATHAVTIETDRVNRAARTAKNFVEWADNYYTTWVENSFQGIDNARTNTIKQMHADESKRQLLDVAGASTHETLPGNVQEVTATWGDRIPDLINQVMESIQ